jgi:hypothetical protein
VSALSSFPPHEEEQRQKRDQCELPKKHGNLMARSLLFGRKLPGRLPRTFVRRLSDPAPLGAFPV